MMRDSSQNRVLVTGGSRGIGHAVAKNLSQLGWEVHAPERSKLDLASRESVGTYLKQNQRFDALVLNAAINPISPVIEGESFEDALQVNLLSNVYIAKTILPHMIENRFGRIVAVSSQYAQKTKPGRSSYSASKAALESYMRSIAVEYASANIIANSVAPGFVDSDLTRKNNGPEAIARLEERIPVGRLAKPEEIARLVAFLLDSENTYLTGQSIAIDGGWSCT